MGWLIASNVGLLAAVLGLGVVVLSLARQIGVLHERTAPAGAVSRFARQAQSRDVGHLVATDLVGTSAPLLERAAERPLALLFVGTDCPVCKALLPGFERALENLDVLPCYVGAPGPNGDHERYAQELRLDAERYFLGDQLAVAMQVLQTPTLVVVGANGQIALRETLRGTRHLAAVAQQLARTLGEQR